MTLENQIMHIVRERPGLAVRELAEFFPDRPRSSISGRTSVMIARGDLRREWRPHPKAQKGVRGATKEGVLFISNGAPVPKPRKVSAPPSSALVDHLRAEVETLKAWRAEAIARYPDLAVDPLLLKARQIVAKAIKDKNEGGWADAYQQVISGQRDNSVAIVATLAALEQAA